LPRLLHRVACVLAGLTVAAAASAAKPPPLDPGLVATYAAGDRRVTRVTLTPDFTLQPGETIHPRIPADFSLTYDGVLRILHESDYTFSADGGGAITVDSQPAGTVHLTPGDHAFHVAYTRKPGAARLQLVWSSPSFPPEPIPSAAVGHIATSQELAQSSEIERGRLLIQDLNCVACHKPPAATLTGRAGPDLSTVGSRVNSQWILTWLENPQHFRPTAVMPGILRNDQDRRDVATYLATLKNPKADGRTVTATPDLAHTGEQLFNSIGCANCHNATGPSLDGQASKWASAAALSQYLLDPMAVDPSGRMPGMLLDQGQADALAAYLFTATAHPRVPEFESSFPAGDAQHGQSLFQSAGCANCHTLASAPPQLAAAELTHVNPDAGCLAASPPAGSPIYALTPADRQSLVAYLRSLASLPEVSEPAPTYAYEEHLKQFNCTACHSAGEASTHAKAEGVPPLSIVGQKLRPDWIKAVLEDKQRVRPWLKTRMPHFGPAVHPLVAELIATSGCGPAEITPAPTPQLVAEGRRLVGSGSGGLSCITCHSVNGGPVAAPEQSRGPELTLMATRLRGDWFRRWVREPGRIIPNTVMPSFFAGKPIDESTHTIETIWAYLSLGSAIPTPNGANQADKTKFVLTPTDRPIVQRCYLEGGGVAGQYNPIPRAVAVGLPGGLSYAFDPESAQLRYVWSGDFLDMTGGWNGRGDTHGKRLGTPFYNAPPGPQIYVDSVSTKPTLAYRGYSVTKEGVDLLYKVNEVDVGERIAASPHSRSFTRTFTVGPSNKPLYLVFPADPKVTLKPSAGVFGPVPTPTGWDAKAKAVAIKLTPPTALSVTITPEAK
jgi:mono/diheme cytochrome c family protein